MKQPFRAARKVVLVISDLGSGGAQQALSQLANAWADAGRQVGVITFSSTESDFFQLNKNVERICLDETHRSRTLFSKIANNLRRIARLRRALRHFRGWTAVGFVMQTNLLLIASSIGLGYRVIISERNDPARQSFGWAWDALRRWFYARADLVTANSHGALQTLRAFVPEGKLAYVPNPLREDPEKQNTPPSRREKIFLNVGRLHPQKGQDLLLRAFALVAPKLPNWQLVILGEGPFRPALESLAAELGLENRVSMPGVVENPYPWYRRAGIFVLTSHFEGSPNALMEAMACGTPCVVCDGSPGPLELVEDAVSGLVVPGEDEVALAGTLIQLAGDAALARKLGKAAKIRMSANSLPIVLAVWDEILELERC